MKLLYIVCKEKDGGFRHAVYSTVNKKVSLDYACKFAGTLQTQDEIKEFTSDPKKFVEDLGE